MSSCSYTKTMRKIVRCPFLKRKPHIYLQYLKDAKLNDLCEILRRIIRIVLLLLHGLHIFLIQIGETTSVHAQHKIFLGDLRWKLKLMGKKLYD